MPTRAEYEAAKEHQRDNPQLYAASDPSPEVIANVAIINEYESSQPDDGTCPCTWYVDTNGVCGCSHTQEDHVDGLCTAPPVN